MAEAARFGLDLDLGFGAVVVRHRAGRADELPDAVDRFAGGIVAKA
jgi:hypothetical protein